MKTLKILWQRLIDEGGSTCPRCHGTHEEIQLAVKKLQAVLKPLDIEPVLTTQEIKMETFLSNPSESNKIWIADKPIEEWLGATTGSSRCCNECGDNDCRTMEVGNQTYEVIPEDLIVRAGMMAATKMMDSDSGQKQQTGSTGCGCSGSKCC